MANCTVKSVYRWPSHERGNTGVPCVSPHFYGDTTIRQVLFQTMYSNRIVWTVSSEGPAMSAGRLTEERIAEIRRARERHAEEYLAVAIDDLLGHIAALQEDYDGLQYRYNKLERVLMTDKELHEEIYRLKGECDRLRAANAALTDENYSDLLAQMDEAWGQAREIGREEINAFLGSRMVHRPTTRLRAPIAALEQELEVYVVKLQQLRAANAALTAEKEWFEEFACSCSEHSGYTCQAHAELKEHLRAKLATVTKKESTP